MNNPENTDVILMLTCFFPQNFKHYFFFFFKFLNIVQPLCTYVPPSLWCCSSAS